MNTRGILAALILLALVGAFYGGQNATRDTNNVIVEEGNMSVFSITVGDCLTLPDSRTEFSSILATPCGNPHDAEVFFEFEFSLAAYDADLIAEAADERCSANFEGYVGLPYIESIYYVNHFTPTYESWQEAGDPSIQCLILGDGTSKIVGSAKGSRE